MSEEPINMDDLDIGWFVRDNEEMDEKLPMMAKEVIKREIDYHLLDNDEPNEDTVVAFIDVLSDHLYSFTEMTQEEIANAIQQLWLATILVEGVEKGLFEEVDGKYRCKESS